MAPGTIVPISFVSSRAFGSAALVSISDHEKPLTIGHILAAVEVLEPFTACEALSTQGVVAARLRSMEAFSSPMPFEDAEPTTRQESSDQ